MRAQLSYLPVALIAAWSATALAADAAKPSAKTELSLERAHTAVLVMDYQNDIVNMMSEKARTWLPETPPVPTPPASPTLACPPLPVAPPVPIHASTLLSLCVVPLHQCLSFFEVSFTSAPVQVLRE